MRPPRDEPITAIRVDEQTENPISNHGKHYAIRPDDVLEELRKTWDPIFNKSDPNITWEKFLEKYGHLIKKESCELKVLNADDYHQAVQELSASRAVAGCGYRVQELKALPRKITELYCRVFQFIEDGGDWPESLLEVFASALRKSE
eukprot:430422-Pyramimonas_sp.AAC.1